MHARWVAPIGYNTDMTTTTHHGVVGAVHKQLFIGGGWRDAASAATFPVEDPGTERTLCEVADGSPEDARAALDAAVSRQQEWAAYPPRERGEILRRAFELMTQRADDLATLMTLEMGKSVTESRAEVAYAAEFFRWFSEQAVRIDGRWARSPSGAERLVTMKQPVGPCLLVTPWNFPVAMGTRKIGPAVAAGCTMVLKPAQLTPLTMLALAEIMVEAGLPEGVLNIVPSSSASGVTAPLISDPRLRKLSFTGSTPVGRRLMGQASENLQRISLELGGNAPFLVFEDADVDAAAEGAVTAKMRNNGESCVAANRFYVHESIAEEFTARLTERMGKMKVGHGTEDGVQVGPLVSAEQRDKVRELVDDAVGKGAQVRTGAAAGEGQGYFYDPTVLSGVPDDARLLREEVFGPVAPVATFSSEEQALARANDTEFGLVAYTYTRDLNRTLRVVEGLEVGMVGVNRGIVSNPAAPFGGVKQSGFGREGGIEGIEEFLATKYAAIQA